MRTYRKLKKCDEREIFSARTYRRLHAYGTACPPHAIACLNVVSSIDKPHFILDSIALSLSVSFVLDDLMEISTEKHMHATKR
eukprot:scaffold145692_cov63-Attheya_sp.AAC.1